VSNVFGFVLPVGDIAALCRKEGVPLIVDASQSAGSLPVDLAAWGADFVAMPGHKGLLGPQGTGLLLCGRTPEPLLYGGTGTASRAQSMPAELPERLEAGTHNMPGIAGLAAGLSAVRRLGTARICRHEVHLRRLLADSLARIDGLELFESGGEVQSGVLSVRAAGLDCELLAEKLAIRGVAVRAGLHCAPYAHESVGTLETGTVRFSVSPMNTAREIRQAAAAVAEILNKR